MSDTENTEQLENVEQPEKLRNGRGQAFGLRCKFASDPETWIYYENGKEFCEKNNISNTNLQAALKFGNVNNPINIGSKKGKLSVISIVALEKIPVTIDGIPLATYKQIGISIIEKLADVSEEMALKIFTYDIMEPKIKPL